MLPFLWKGKRSMRMKLYQTHLIFNSRMESSVWHRMDAQEMLTGTRHSYSTQGYR